MSNYATVTSTRVTEPDMAALLATARSLDVTVGISHNVGTAVYIGKKSTDWTLNQITQLQSAVDNAPAITPQRLAQNNIDAWTIDMKALVLTLIDQINVLRTAAGLTTITPAQALQSIRNKAGTL